MKEDSKMIVGAGENGSSYYRLEWARKGVHIKGLDGRMKVEWLDQCYKTKEEAISDVYEYIWAYYNSSRLHSTNGYATPEESYSKKVAA